VIGNPLLLGDEGGYNLTRSLRFRSSASAYLTRTPATASNRKTWTWSGWVKRGALSGTQIIFAAAFYEFRIISDGGASGTVDSLQLTFPSGYGIQTNAVLRDPAAWYHLVLTVDTTQATASNRAKIYINGNQLTSSGATDFTLNLDTDVNNTVSHVMGRRYNNTILYFDGYMAEVNFIDGQALNPSSFGAYSIYNQWLPKKYAGTYGTNGFYLPFTNNASAATLGNDFSGNSNTWTTNNISVTAGSTYDSMTDVPTLTSATAANYCVLNPLECLNSTLSNANLTVAVSPTGGGITASSLAVTTGKWYCELTFASTAGVTAVSIGVGPTSTYQPNIFSVGVNYYAGDGSKYVSGVNTAYGATWTTGDTMAIALDVDGGTITFYKNNTSQGAITLPASSSGWKIVLQNGGGGTSKTFNCNFGQQPWTYSPPSGYVALNTFNL